MHGATWRYRLVRGARCCEGVGSARLKREGRVVVSCMVEGTVCLWRFDDGRWMKLFHSWRLVNYVMHVGAIKNILWIFFCYAMNE